MGTKAILKDFKTVRKRTQDNYEHKRTKPIRERTRSADFQICRIADFQSARGSNTPNADA
jgi:hypothetical protein